MRVLRVRNVHEALPLGMDLLREHGISRDSRNGPVVQMDMPMTTVYERPCERVLFHPWRGENPFFGIYESLHMLSGRNDIAPLTRYVPRMGDFSDDGVTQNAAYGYRWRSARPWNQSDDGRDQLIDIITLLKKDHLTRQCVLQIWDHYRDLGTNTKDHACNIAASFQVDAFGHLDMVLFCRSNDAIWGAMGANVVHFSVLQEYIARFSGLPVGSFTQISVNYHGYEKIINPLFKKRDEFGEMTPNPYSLGEVEPYRIAHPDNDQEAWDNEVRRFVTPDGRATLNDNYREPFFRHVAWPIVRAHDSYKDEKGVARYEMALSALETCKASDWRRACVEWLERRRHNEENKNA